MMYRSGWATKENQERVLAVDITHEGFSWALEHACLSHFDSSIYTNSVEWKMLKDKSPVVIQWDPERDILLNKLSYRAIQIGLTPPAAKLYVGQWILNITDITSVVKQINALIGDKKTTEAEKLLPLERVYPIKSSFIVI
jgi:hypothetical protein